MTPGPGHGPVNQDRYLLERVPNCTKAPTDAPYFDLDEPPGQLNSKNQLPLATNNLLKTTGREKKMKNAGKILVTGSTGNVGSRFIPNLIHLGADVGALTRGGSKARGLGDAGDDIIVGDLERSGRLDAAFQGVDKVFLITPPNPNQVIQAENGIQAAKRTGRPFIVRLSPGAGRRVSQHGPVGYRLSMDD